MNVIKLANKIKTFLHQFMGQNNF